MKKLKRIICICMILIILVNNILPRISLAAYSYDSEEESEIILAIKDGTKEKIKAVIENDKNNNDDNYTLTKQFLQEMNSYRSEFAEKIDVVIEKMFNERKPRGSGGT